MISPSPLAEWHRDPSALLAIERTERHPNYIIQKYDIRSDSSLNFSF